MPSSSSSSGSSGTSYSSIARREELERARNAALKYPLDKVRGIYTGKLKEYFYMTDSGEGVKRIVSGLSTIVALLCATWAFTERGHIDEGYDTFKRSVSFTAKDLNKTHSVTGKALTNANTMRESIDVAFSSGALKNKKVRWLYNTLAKTNWADPAASKKATKAIYKAAKRWLGNDNTLKTLDPNNPKEYVQGIAVLLIVSNNKNLKEYTDELHDVVAGSVAVNGGNFTDVDALLLGRIKTGEIDVKEILKTGSYTPPGSSTPVKLSDDALVALSALDIIAHETATNEQAHQTILSGIGYTGKVGKLKINRINSVQDRIKLFCKALDDSGLRAIKSNDKDTSWTKMSSKQIRAYLKKFDKALTEPQKKAINEFLSLREHLETLTTIKKYMLSIGGLARRYARKGLGDSDIAVGLDKITPIYQLSKFGMRFAIKHFNYALTGSIKLAKWIGGHAPVPVQSAAKSMAHVWNSMSKLIAGKIKDAAKVVGDTAKKVSKVASDTAKSIFNTVTPSSVKTAVGTLKNFASKIGIRTKQTFKDASAKIAQRTILKKLGKVGRKITKALSVIVTPFVFLKKGIIIIELAIAALLIVLVLITYLGSALTNSAGILTSSLSDFSDTLFETMSPSQWKYETVSEDKRNRFYETIFMLQKEEEKLSDVLGMLEENGYTYYLFPNPEKEFESELVKTDEESMEEAETIYYYHKDVDGTLTKTPLTPFSSIKTAMAMGHVVTAPIDGSSSIQSFQKYAKGVWLNLNSSDISANIKICKGCGEYLYFCNNVMDYLYNHPIETHEENDIIEVQPGEQHETFILVGCERVDFNYNGCLKTVYNGLGSGTVYYRYPEWHYLKDAEEGTVSSLSEMAESGSALAVCYSEDADNTNAIAKQYDTGGYYHANPKIDDRCKTEISNVLTSTDSTTVSLFKNSLSYCTSLIHCTNHQFTRIKCKELKFHSLRAGEPCECGALNCNEFEFTTASGVTVTYYSCRGFYVESTKYVDVCLGHYQCAGHYSCEGHTAVYCTGHIQYKVEEWQNIEEDSEYNDWSYDDTETIPAHDVGDYHVAETTRSLTYTNKSIEEAQNYEGWNDTTKDLVKYIEEQDWYEKYGVECSLMEGGQLSAQELKELLKTYDIRTPDVSEARMKAVLLALDCIGKVPTYEHRQAYSAGTADFNEFGAQIGEYIGENGTVYENTGLGREYFADWIIWSSSYEDENNPVYVRNKALKELAVETMSITRCNGSNLMAGDVILRVQKNEETLLNEVAETRIVLGYVPTDWWTSSNGVLLVLTVGMGEHWCEMSTVDLNAYTWYRVNSVY